MQIQHKYFIYIYVINSLNPVSCSLLLASVLYWEEIINGEILVNGWPADRSSEFMLTSACLQAKNLPFLLPVAFLTNLGTMDLINCLECSSPRGSNQTLMFYQDKYIPFAIDIAVAIHTVAVLVSIFSDKKCSAIILRFSQAVSQLSLNVGPAADHHPQKMLHSVTSASLPHPEILSLASSFYFLSLWYMAYSFKYPWWMLSTVLKIHPWF